MPMGGGIRSRGHVSKPVAHPSLSLSIAENRLPVWLFGQGQCHRAGRISSASPQMGQPKEGRKQGLHRGGPPQSGPAFRRDPRGLPGGPSKRRLTRGRDRHRETERPLRLKMFAQDLFLLLSSTHDHGYSPRCPSKHISETAMALCIAPSIPNITARHLVPWHLIQTRRHCRYLEHILSTPRSVKWDHIVR
jgi:hypothetical protein